MPLRWSIRPNAYHDSIKLMRVSEALAALPGVRNGAAVMATPLNLELLAGEGLLPDGQTVTPDDLLITILADDSDAAEAALAQVDMLLQAQAPQDSSLKTQDSRLKTPEQARARGATLAVIAVPGPLAAAEAYAALRAGLDVFLFSDNVSLEDEIRLKRLAAKQGLLMMGPDCGTAIVNGVGLGFANRVQPGPVGIVGASGTGIQELCCLLDLAGLGVAQAIGTGGRDLSARVAGAMTRRALAMLDKDPEVEAIAVVSKPAGDKVTQRLHADMEKLSKPAVACLLGAELPATGRTRYATTLTDAAALVAETLGVGDSRSLFGVRSSPPAPGASRPEQRTANSEQLIHGLYTGGTLCSEAARVLDAMGAAHELIDLGADEYTRGRAHPMIDPRLRNAMLAELAGNPNLGAVLLDVVLGDLAHPDPAGALAPALESLPDEVSVFAALIGTQRDPQDLDRQRATLEAAGATVFASNAQAAAAAGEKVRQFVSSSV